MRNKKVIVYMTTIVSICAIITLVNQNKTLNTIVNTKFKSSSIMAAKAEFENNMKDFKNIIFGSDDNDKDTKNNKIINPKPTKINTKENIDNQSPMQIMNKIRNQINNMHSNDIKTQVEKQIVKINPTIEGIEKSNQKIETPKPTAKKPIEKPIENKNQYKEPTKQVRQIQQQPAQTQQANQTQNPTPQPTQQKQETQNAIVETPKNTEQTTAVPQPIPKDNFPPCVGRSKISPNPTLPIVDKIDYPFENDPSVMGTWFTYDFLCDASEFCTTHKHWQGTYLLEQIAFSNNGEFKLKTADTQLETMQWIVWTRGHVLHKGDKTDMHYYIKNVDGKAYLFLEWKSSDYINQGFKPCLYVFSRK